jgi:hypothetical protein
MRNLGERESTEYEQRRVRDVPALGGDAQAHGCREQQENELEAGH